MHNFYLDKLGLQPGATKHDIKKAYRQMSKKYHPDINNSKDAKELFIEIAEAYNFLTNVGPNPHQEKVSYDYDPSVEEYKRRRERAREKAQQQAEVEAKLRQKMYQQLIVCFNITSAIVLFFNLILAADYFLPPKEIKLTPDDIQEASARSRREGGYRGGFTLTFDDFQIYLPDDAFYIKKHKVNASVFSTPIMHTPLYMLSNGRRNRIYKQTISLYVVFGPIILMVMGGSFMYFVLLKAPDPKVYIGMVLIVLFLIQLFINSRYS